MKVVKVIGYVGWVLTCVGFTAAMLFDAHATFAGACAAIGVGLLLAVAPAAIAMIEAP